MASLVEFYWKDSKDDISSNQLTVGEGIPIHLYEEYETPEDESKVLYIVHPSLDAPQKLENMSYELAQLKIRKNL